MPWIVILAIVWGNPDSRIQANVGDVIRIERVEVATEADCRRAAQDWVLTNNNLGRNGTGNSAVTATCAGQKPSESPTQPSRVVSPGP